jgi:hypothetical protein
MALFRVELHPYDVSVVHYRRKIVAVTGVRHD